MVCRYRLLIWCKVSGEWPICEFGSVHDFEGECLEELFDKISFLMPSSVIDHVDVYVNYPSEDGFFFVAGRIFGVGDYRIFDTYVKRLFYRRSTHVKKKKTF